MGKLYPLSLALFLPRSPSISLSLSLSLKSHSTNLNYGQSVGHTFDMSLENFMRDIFFAGGKTLDARLRLPLSLVLHDRTGWVSHRRWAVGSGGWGGEERGGGQLIIQTKQSQRRRGFAETAL